MAEIDPSAITLPSETVPQNESPTVNVILRSPVEPGPDLNLSQPRLDTSYLNAEKRYVEPSWWDRWVSSMNESARNSTFGGVWGATTLEPGSIARMALDYEQELEDSVSGMEKMQPEDLNKMYPGMPQPFSKPTDPVLAKVHYDLFKKRERDREFAAGASWPLKVFSTVTGIANQISDPGMLFGFGLGGKILGKLGVGEGLAKVFGENLIGFTATEIPNIIQQTKEHDAESVGADAANIAIGAMTGTALHYVPWARMFGALVPDSVKERWGRISMAAHEDGKAVPGEAAVKDLKDTVANPEKPPQEMQQVDNAVKSQDHAYMDADTKQEIDQLMKETPEQIKKESERVTDKSPELLQEKVKEDPPLAKDIEEMDNGVKIVKDQVDKYQRFINCLLDHL